MAMSSIYHPELWTDGPHAYATCSMMQWSVNGLTYKDRRTFENRLWRELKNKWEVMPDNLRLEYQQKQKRVQITFLDENEYFLLKLQF
jgi:hypothetical protein